MDTETADGSASLRAHMTTKEMYMKLMPMGDYYIWFCEWCDSRNLTLWTRFEKGDVYCGACHKAFYNEALSNPAAVNDGVRPGIA